MHQGNLRRSKVAAHRAGRGRGSQATAGGGDACPGRFGGGAGDGGNQLGDRRRRAGDFVQGRRAGGEREVARSIGRGQAGGDGRRGGGELQTEPCQLRT